MWVKAKEEQIRQAALILAGQCVALLLHNLAQSKEAHIIAATSRGDDRARKLAGAGA